MIFKKTGKKLTKIKKIFFSLTTILFFCNIFFSTFAATQKKLYFLNISKENQRELIKEIPPLKNDFFNKYHLNLAIKHLMKTDNYENVYLKQKDQEPIYYLEGIIKRKINEINIDGNKNFSTRKIKNIINLTEGTAYDQYLINDINERIQEFYKNEGFLQTKVDVEVSNTNKKQINLNIKINEKYSCKIKRILIISENKNLNRKLQEVFTTKLNKPLNDNITENIKNKIIEYFIEKHYILATVSNVEISYEDEQKRAILKFFIKDPYFYDIKIEGTKEVNSVTLSQDLKIKNYKTTNPKFVLEIINNIQNYYLEKGYANVKINHEEKQNNKKFKKKIIININEGDRVKIEKFIVKGNISKSPEYYKEYALNNSHKIIKQGFYNQKFLQTGVDNLIVHLQNQGYFQAKIILFHSYIMDNTSKAIVKLVLNEGPLTIVTGLNFIGNKKFSNHQLLSLISLKENHPLSLEKLNNSLQSIKNYYFDNGYLEMHFIENKKNLIKYSHNNTRAQINFKLIEGPKIIVNDILIEGNGITKDFVILLELDFNIRDILTPEKIEESTARLQKTGLFLDVQIKILEQGSKISERTILVKVTERPPGLFNMGIGVSNERGITARGFLGLAYRNMEGRARALSSRLEIKSNIDIDNEGIPNYLEYKFNVGFAENYLLKTRTRGSINLTNEQKVISSEEDKIRVLETIEAAFFLERFFTSHIRGKWTIWQISRIREFYKSGKTIYGTPSSDLYGPIVLLPFGPQKIASMGPLIEFDWRDDIFNPTKGIYIRLLGEYASPDLGSTNSIKFFKVSTNITHYKKLLDGSDFVWANSIRGGYLKNLLDDGAIPYNKVGFILGGRSTIRGFDPYANERIPSYEDLGITSDDIFGLTTSSDFFLFKSELRFPIYNNFGGSIFYDGGTVLIKGLTFKDEYRDSIGIGLRYITPFGPLNIEYAQKLDKKNNESLNRIHFSIGSF